MKKTGHSILFWLVFASAIGIGLALRLISLGSPFVSSDNLELAYKIIRNSGYLWMAHEYYGILISLLVKLSTGLFSLAGMTITEFWWRFPLAFIGSLQAPLTFLFLIRLGCRRAIGLCGAMVMAILPIHVMQSRYLWGYEILGVFCLTLAIWSLLDFFEAPALKTGVLASFFCGLYLISHGYIIPFIPFLVFTVFLFTPSTSHTIPGRIGAGVRLLFRKRVWVFPLLFIPLYITAVGHALVKRSRLGFYLFDHLPGFLGNVGICLFVLMLFSILAGILFPKVRTKHSLLLTAGGACYLTPLVFGAQPGITVVRGYMLMGVYLLLVSMLVFFNSIAESRKKLVAIILTICCLWTFWGTVESIFARGKLFDPSLVRIERGGIDPDPGGKAAGYLVRKHLSPALRILCIHRNIEPSNLFYFFGREKYAYYDLSVPQTLEKFAEQKNHVDAVICDSDPQVNCIEASGLFVRKVVLFSEGVPRLWIYARPGISMPTVYADVEKFNAAFDREFSWRVSLR